VLQQTLLNTQKRTAANFKYVAKTRTYTGVTGAGKFSISLDKNGLVSKYSYDSIDLTSDTATSVKGSFTYKANTALKPMVRAIAKPKNV